MKNKWEKARVLEASDRSYAEIVLPLLENARREIAASLYLVDADDAAGPLHPVNRFLEALLRARQRGVRVRIILNTKFRIRLKADVALGNYFDRLLKAGVEITTILPNQRLHDKLIVIDGRYVVEGSTNWSVSALRSNRESNSIIDSPAHARKKLERIERLLAPPLPRLARIDTPLLPVTKPVEIPLALFSDNKLKAMVRASDIRSLNLYLILLGEQAARGKSEMVLDLETLGGALALPPEWTRSQIRRQVIKTLRKLALRYKLLEVEFPYGRDAQIRLKNFGGPTVSVPSEVFDSSSLSKDTTGTTFLALAREVLKKEGIEIDSLSAASLEDRFGIGASTVIRSRGKTNLLSTPLPDGRH